MLTDDYKPQEFLQYIDPSGCTYQEWVTVGMALKKGGYPCEIWDAWSQHDPRYKVGECFSKWESFHGGSMQDVSMGTVVKMAMDNGFAPGRTNDNEVWTEDTEFTLSLEDADLKVVDMHWLEDSDVPGPGNSTPVQQIIRYLELLFNPSDYVGIVTQATADKQDDGTIKYRPNKGFYDKTAGELTQALYACGGDVGKVLGDLADDWGAWIRFNPLDGKGASDSNVTAYHYALVECDALPIEKQYALIKQLELPCACIVHSGSRSLHAIVKVDAASFQEYRSQVDYLYKVCAANGLKLDTNNRNPSRLSRMPGATRKGRPQYIVAENIGQESFDKWKEFIESINDDLPEIQSFTSFLGHPPALSPELIQGVLRMGHKMLLCGPSKAGKSFALIELSIAIGEGLKWMGFQCTQGKVLYINLELDTNSCLNRFNDVYKALNIQQPHPENIDIWNLRGKSEPMDKLAPKLIRRAKEAGYAAIIIDPIYKVITGDENSADQMAMFCNQFDRIADSLACSVIYCHHHSKGGQSTKRAADRASGSGVFSRDPDAMIDMLEIELTEDERDQMIEEARAKVAFDWCKAYFPDNYLAVLNGVDCTSGSGIISRMKLFLAPDIFEKDYAQLCAVIKRVEQRTAWKIEGTLREFPAFEPFSLYFEWPVHIPDTGFLKGKTTKSLEWGSDDARDRGLEAIKRKREKDAQERKIAWEMAIEETDGDWVKMVEYLGKSSETIRRWAKEYGYVKAGSKYVKNTHDQETVEETQST